MLSYLLVRSHAKLKLVGNHAKIKLTIAHHVKCASNHNVAVLLALAIRNILSLPNTFHAHNVIK